MRLCPRAEMSGFTRPSFAGPRELNVAADGGLVVVRSAPTASTFFAAPVTVIVSHGVWLWCITSSQPALHGVAGQSVPLPLSDTQNSLFVTASPLSSA